MPHLKQLLLRLNLNNKEVAVLLSLVRLGKATAAAVARDSGITRTHIYDLVANLVDRGLVSEIEERGIKTYEAVDHTGLMAYITRQQKELQQIEKKVGQLATEFNALELGAKQKTKVRFFDGPEGVKNIYAEIRQDFQKTSERFELLTIFSPERVASALPEFEFFSYPNSTGRDIVCDDPFLSEYQRQITTAGHGVQYRVWPKTKGLFPTDNIAWINKIAYIDLVGYPAGIIIENESIYQSFTMWFNALWEKLESVPPLL